MNIYSEDELMNNKPEYKFVLVNDQTGERLYDLDAEFVEDEGWELRGYQDCPDVWSAESAYSEALRRLGYSVKVVKK